MMKSTAADREAPLTDDLLLEERLAFLLRRANMRQFWMLFLHEDDVQTDVVMPCADLPADPSEMSTTSDLGETTHAALLGHRIGNLMREFGFAQAVFVWERPGSAEVGNEERAWAAALGAACANNGARVRAQFILHDHGVRILAPDDYLGA